MGVSLPERDLHSGLAGENFRLAHAVAREVGRHVCAQTCSCEVPRQAPLQGGNLLVQRLNAQQGHARRVDGGNGGFTRLSPKTKRRVEVLGHRADVSDGRIFRRVVPLSDRQGVYFLEDIGGRDRGKVLLEVAVRGIRPYAAGGDIGSRAHDQRAKRRRSGADADVAVECCHASVWGS